MVEDSENEEDYLEDERANGGSDSKETDQADLAKVDTSEDLLKRAWVDETTGVNVGIVDKEEVVLVGEVEEI